MLSIVMVVYDPSRASTLMNMTEYSAKLIEYRTSSEWELIVVMNGRTAKEYEFPSTVRQIHLSERVSIAEAYNLGAMIADGDFICNMHNDCMVPQGWDFPLIEEARCGNIAFPKIDESQSGSVWRGIPNAPEWMPPSCCFVLTKKLWDDLKGYDERFDELHWEDTDLFYRAVKKGALLMQCDVVVEHWRAMTRSMLPDKGEAAMIRNKMKFMEKHEVDEKFGTWQYPMLSNVEATKKYIEQRR